MYQIGQELRERLNCQICRRELEGALSRYQPQAELPEGNGQICQSHQREIEEAMGRYLPVALPIFLPLPIVTMAGR